MLVYIFISSTVVALIVFKVEKDIVIGSSVVFSVTIIVALKLIVGISVGIAIIIVIILRRLLRVYPLTSLFSLAEQIFASFAL
jgi:hypothetical protein